MRVLGLILLLLGVLLAGGSGLCTAAFLIPALSHAGRENFGLMLPFMFGGPFILIGALMCWGGWRLGRRKPRPFDPREFD